MSIIMIEASYSPKGDIACKGCKQKIQEASLRLGYVWRKSYTKIVQDWYHLECFELRPTHTYIDPEQNIFNLDNIDKDNRQAVIDLIREEKERVSRGDKKIGPIGKYKRVKKDKQENVEEAPGDDDNNSGKSKRSQKSQKKEKKEEQKKQTEQKQQKKSKEKKSKA